uniref:Uncharacterized protein n=1 Tax=Rhizophora mucronata TaxID=61149 RepID=A0A2P2NPU0_RHIMU
MQITNMTDIAACMGICMHKWGNYSPF